MQTCWEIKMTIFRLWSLMRMSSRAAEKEKWMSAMSREDSIIIKWEFFETLEFYPLENRGQCLRDRAVRLVDEPDGK